MREAAALRTTPDRTLANEWALVLSSQGLGARVTRGSTGWVLWAAAEEHESAEAHLRVWERENAGAAARARTVPAPVFSGPAPRATVLATVAAMLAFYGVTGPRDPYVLWFQRGSADAARIFSGEPWRALTALSLHADLAHLLGNALFGAFFLTALARSVGPGLALALAIGAGAGGNLLNAGLRSAAHVSVGASTAVFGCVGALCGLAVVRRRERGEGWRRAALPLAGGLALLAMLGVAGGRVDIWAHLFGLVAGVALGAGVGALPFRQPGPWVQGLVGAGAVATLLAGWWMALA